MLQPYSDKPESTGLLRMPPQELAPAVQKWVDAGYQVNTHAIGDRANRLAIQAYESVVSRVGMERDLRLRIEHAQIIVRLPSSSFLLLSADLPFPQNVVA